MTIARNIEAESSNWSSQTAGTGFIYNGRSNETTLGCVGDGDGSWGEPTGTDCTEKRADGKPRNVLTLSSKQEIYDFAGNVWEHVNGGNTLDGINSATMKGNACGAQLDDNWNSFTNNTTTDTIRQCNFTNGYTYASI